MKRKLLIVLAICAAIWAGSVINGIVLTRLHGDEFDDLEQIGITYLEIEDSPIRFRVLRYGAHEAVVYYFNDGVGEKILLSKSNNTWVCEKSLACWSRSGSADDYCVWPYFKNWVI